MLNLEIYDITKAVLIFIRIGGILFFLPVFGDSPIPVKVRTLTALAMTFAFYPLTPAPNLDIANLGLIAWTIIIFKELFLGFSLGFIARLVIEGIVMAASLVGYQMGFGMANLLVPDADQQMNSYTALHRVIILLILLGLNLHYVFLNGMAESLTIVPLGGLNLSADLGSYLIKLTADIFVVSLQLSAPILVALMFTMAALGLIARAVPQINIFTLSFPVSFFVGLLVYIACFPFYPDWIQQQLFNNQQQVLTVISSFKPF